MEESGDWSVRVGGPQAPHSGYGTRYRSGEGFEGAKAHSKAERLPVKVEATNSLSRYCAPFLSSLLPFFQGSSLVFTRPRGTVLCLVVQCDAIRDATRCEPTLGIGLTRIRGRRQGEEQRARDRGFVFRDTVHRGCVYGRLFWRHERNPTFRKCARLLTCHGIPVGRPRNRDSVSKIDFCPVFRSVLRSSGMRKEHHRETVIERIRQTGVLEYSIVQVSNNYLLLLIRIRDGCRFAKETSREYGYGEIYWKLGAFGCADIFLKLFSYYYVPATPGYNLFFGMFNSTMLRKSRSRSQNFVAEANMLTQAFI